MPVTELCMVIRNRVEASSEHTNLLVL